MTPEEVNMMLASYKECASRCKLLEEKKRFLENDIEFYSNLKAEDVIQITSPMTGMPHGSTVSDPTSKAAIMIADGDGAGKIPALRREIQEIEDELRIKQPTVVYVDAMLIVLNDRERFIIEQKPIDGLTWRQVAGLYQIAFGEMYSEQGLKKLCKAALQKLYKIAE